MHLPEKTKLDIDKQGLVSELYSDLLESLSNFDIADPGVISLQELKEKVAN